MEMFDSNKPICVRPPQVTIDLSLPPSERYKSIARSQAAKLRSLARLYDNLLLNTGISPKLIKPIHIISRLLLRQVYDSEETQELKGIAKVSGVPMYLLVAFNVLLDILMGCTSGGVLSQENGQPRSSAKMLHFRTLDWDMDPLREVVVQLNFIRSKSTQPKTVIASSVTYIGFVGVLTGVKPGLSLSLNFRAVHDATTKREQLRFYLHHLMILLGRRPSIASILRHYILDNHQDLTSEQSALDVVVADMKRRLTTAAYLIFSDGQSTITMEKDYSTALTDSSDTFIVRTNHDVNDHKVELKPIPVVTQDGNNATRAVGGLKELLDESRERLGCITKQYETKMIKSSVSRRRSIRIRQKEVTDVETGPSLPTCAEIIQWLCTWTTTNECTHVAVVMDPKVGEVVWCRAYPLPLTEPYKGTIEWVAIGPKNRKRQWVSVAAEELDHS
jgi:hypothetical protein